MSKKRNLDYEKKFRTYLYSFDFETHKKICLNVNVKHIEQEDTIKHEERINKIIEKEIN
jgi:hypothetical protein